MTDPAAVEAALGVRFADRTLLELALTHRSYAFEAGGLPTNERLEFLGDAVLGLVVSMHLYDGHPDQPEGSLSTMRAAAVKSPTLAAAARRIGLGDHVRLGKGEEQSGGRDKDSILADTFEALVGAVYLDAGLATTAAAVQRVLGDVLAELAREGATADSKTALQELAVRLKEVPVYEVTDEGPDHAKRFRATVSVGGEELGGGEGRSKKEAELAAAREALSRLRAAVSSQR